MKLSCWMALSAVLILSSCAPPPATTTTTTSTTTTYVVPAPRPPEIVAERPVTMTPSPDNCGTPAAPQACPPMPRAPLSYYPGSR